jgi:hypothetical protein
MGKDSIGLRERDRVELLPGAALPPGYRVPAGARGRIVILDQAAPEWATVQFGRYRRPVCLPVRHLRRMPPS